MRRRLRALPLRSRLALLTATAVALGVAVCAGAAWFVVRDQLWSSLDDSLRGTRIESRWVVQQVNQGRCDADADADADPPGAGLRNLPPLPNPGGDTAQVIFSGGGSCVLPGSPEVPVTDEDRAVAEGTRRDALHTVTNADGDAFRVYTRRLPGFTDAVSVARPVSEVTGPLGSLALVLALVAAGGVAAAAGVGVVLARAGLRPVDRLTAATEHIARTEDLSVRIPVEGDDEIARLSRSFNSMTAALASSRDLQQQLIGDAGHELRTPLTSLRTNIELLARSEETGRALDPGDRRRLLASVTAQLGELATLIGDLQELSRPEGAGRGRLEVTGLHDAAGRAAARARLRAPGTDVVADLDPWYVRADPAALERSVVNLLDNAVKFGGEAGPVELVLRDGTLSVRDHGPGIAEDQLPHVFERFWRAPDARGLPGSGLGLSIVARTAREFGGSVELLRAPGGGTEARLAFPGGPVPPPELP